MTGDVTTGTAAASLATEALAGRKELALLDDPSVARVAAVLAARCRNPAPWVRAAVGTLARFAAEVASGDLPGLLGQGRADAGAAEASLRRLAVRHDGRDPAQLAALAFGPTLWWQLGGVDLSGLPAGSSRVTPIPRVAERGDAAAREARLLMLSLLGTGLTVDELLRVRVRDAGRLDAEGGVRPDLEAEPLALEYTADDDGQRRLTFLSFEAHAAVREGLAGRRPGPDDPLLLPSGAQGQARRSVTARSAALIGAGNDVNVTLCRATGDFFRAWGMPGARFDPRLSRRPEEMP
jgi:hypothetical protein